HIERLGTHLVRGYGRSIRRHHGRARRMRTNAILDAVRAPMYDPHAAIIHAERLGTDLRNNRFEALAQRSASGDDLDIAARMHIDARAVRGPQTALFDIHCKAEADILAGVPTFLHIALELIPPAARKCLV